MATHFALPFLFIILLVLLEEALEEIFYTSKEEEKSLSDLLKECKFGRLVTALVIATLVTALIVATLVAALVTTCGVPIVVALSRVADVILTVGRNRGAVVGIAAWL